MPVTLKVNTAALEAQCEGIAARLQAATRPAAYAGAKIVYDEVRRNVRKLGRKTGRLENAIYHAYAERDSKASGGAIYRISYAHARRKGAPGAPAPHGYNVEFGHAIGNTNDRLTGQFTATGRRPKDSAPRSDKRVKPHPFVRPAVAVYARAMSAMQQQLQTELRKANLVD
jgi:hypothetical protein